MPCLEALDSMEQTFVCREIIVAFEQKLPDIRIRNVDIRICGAHVV